MRNLIDEGLKVGDTLYRQSDGEAFLVRRIDPFNLEDSDEDSPGMPIACGGYWLTVDGKALGVDGRHIEVLLPELPTRSIFDSMKRIVSSRTLAFDAKHTRIVFAVIVILCELLILLVGIALGLMIAA